MLVCATEHIKKMMTFKQTPFTIPHGFYIAGTPAHVHQYAVIVTVHLHGIIVHVHLDVRHTATILAPLIGTTALAHAEGTHDPDQGQGHRSGKEIG